MMSSNVALLATTLVCQRCGQSEWNTPSGSSGAYRCRRCGVSHAVRDGIVYVESATSDETRREIASIPGTEDDPLLGGWSERADADGSVAPDLAAAYLSLPYGDSSFRFEQPGYFANVRRFAAEFDFITSQIGRRIQTGRLLDVGADGTWSTARLAARGFSCVALDITDHLRLARVYQQVHPPYALVNADMHAPTFRDGAFDVVTAFNVLHHSSQLPDLVANLTRMLRPEGVLGMVEPYVQNESQGAAFGAAQSEQGINENVHTVDHWCAVLSAAGLELDAYSLSDSFNAVWIKSPQAVGSTRRGPILTSGLFEHDFYRAEIEVEPRLARTITNRPATFDVSVSNRGRAGWTSRGPLPIRLSYHLTGQTKDGSRIERFDNERTLLPSFIEPGGRWTAEVTVAIETAGSYELEFDLVHECRTWFKEQGGRTAIARLTVST
jgi:SAM-dependent methyltransferase